MTLHGALLKKICEVKLEGRFGNFVLHPTPQNSRIRRSQYALIIRGIKIVEPVEPIEPLQVCYSLDSIWGCPRKIVWYENANASLRSYISPALDEATLGTERTPYLLVVSKQSYDYIISTSRGAHAAVRS